MNKNLKNIFLLIVALVLAYLTAPYFGSWYDQINPQYDSLFGAPKNITDTVAGLPLAYVFFIPLLFELWGKGKKNWWMIILLAPVILFYLYADLSLVYIPIALAIAGCLIAKLVRLIYSKIHHPNPPMVIK